MGRPVVHFEITGKQPAQLRNYYADLFDWEFSDQKVSDAVSETGNYGFIQPTGDAEGIGIPGGIGGGADYAPRTVFYVSVVDVEESLQRAESLGGTRVSGPHRSPSGSLVVGFFTDPEGNTVGLASL